MPYSKSCEQCGKTFDKPYTCSIANWEKRRFCTMACKSESQLGKPTWSKGKKFPSATPKQMIPCRICGNPTRYNGTKRHPYYNGLPCDNPDCIRQSQELRCSRMSARMVDDYATGKRKKIHHAWDNVQRISPEEIALTPFMQELGFIPQVKLLTNVHTNTLPRQFTLDFAELDQKLYVEIDGSVHRLRKERDARRDAMLAERGWRGFRIPSRRVRESFADVQSDIVSWLTFMSLEHIDNLT